MRVLQLEDFKDLIRVASELTGEGVHCFRGQASEGWGLIPLLYRGLDGARSSLYEADAEIGKIERDVYRQFFIRARRLLPANISNPLEGLAVAQHNGVPTRLLDWTRNPIVAAYFALTSEALDGAAIWALNLSRFPFPTQLGRPQPSGAFRIENLERFLGGRTPSFLQSTSNPPGIPGLSALVVFEAPAIVERLAAQQGLFSLYVSTGERAVVDHGAAIEEAKHQVGGELLTKLIIARPLAEHFREQLPVEPTTIFPDLEGIALTLRAQLRRQLRDF